ncbi:hypothetical protein [Sagittula salina]|uniref:Uncharacterized protein n=1 Tax=Sagittula salina TaxID=2820268 RepID=A0A940MTX3_9RHOB|nr:hypothetical protein [Sagittula salina]MBP0484987.1 hypothetical protein [Sagittula salina]
MRGLALLTTLLTTLSLPAALAAQQGRDSGSQSGSDWQAIVVGQPGPGAHGSFADAFFASRAFERGGVVVLDMIRDLPRARLTDTLTRLEGVPNLLLYYSGRMNSGSISMQDGSMPLATVLDAAAQAGTRGVLLMVENCTDPQAGPGQVIVPDAPNGLTMTVVTSVTQGESCTWGARLSDELRNLAEEPALTGDLMAMLHGVAVTGAAVQVTLTGPIENPEPVEEIVEFLPDDVVQIAVLDGDFSLTGDPEPIEDDVIEILLPAQLPSVPEEIAKAEPVVTFAALPQTQIAAAPIAAGLPKPSILVGLIEGVTDAALSTETDSESRALASFVDDNDDIAASLVTLRKLREDNPEMYAAMLTAGSFDPPDGRILAKVIQTELQRMNCYLGRIDGDYGRGSQRGSSLYYEELKKRDTAALDSPEASIDLFRLILGNDAVDCPKPVVSSAPRAKSTSTSGRASSSSSSRSSGSSTTSTRSTPTTSAPTRSSGGSSGGFGGSNFGGVFR